MENTSHIKTVRADLHCHSEYSNRSSMWALRRFNCPESYTPPQRVYDLAKKRGMDYVTITDHHSISGIQTIAHLPGTFLGTELTTHFPENGCKADVGVVGFQESQFPDLLAARNNVYELVEYLRKEDLTYFLAHPLYDINGLLSLEMVEKFLLLFNVFEVRNGSRSKHFNLLFERIVASLSPQVMDEMANRQGIEPYGENPWVKGLTGGSDDHSGLYIAQTFTECPGGENLKDFLRSVRNGDSLAGGEYGTPLTLAHSIYAVGYNFFSRQLSDNKRLKSYPFMSALLQKMFGGGDLSRSTRLKIALKSALPEIFPNKDRSRTLEAVVDQQIRQLMSDQDFREQLSAGDFNRRVFAATSQLANRLLYHYTKQFMEKKIDGGIMEWVNSLSSIGFVHLLTAPYYLAHHNQTRGKALHVELRNAFGLTDPNADRRKIALFSDTLSDVNGVAITIRRLLQAAPDHGAELVVVDCSHKPTGREGNIMNFKAIGDLALPEYDEMKLHFPPVLDVLDYVVEEGFTAIHVSTPGPLGLMGLLISRLTDLPISGTYHTDVPQYIGCLTDDPAIEEASWNYMVWFYNQLERVLVPSSATRDQLLSRGLSAEKAVPLPRWVDTDRFSPALCDPKIWDRIGAGDGVKLLYAGRVSKEKNLEYLVEAFLEIERSGSPATLIVAGDGPYREEMQEALSGHNAVFTGFISQDELGRMYASADAFVFPSTTDTFGNVVLEAQACGLPVIVTSEGGPQELLVRGRSGLVIRGGETDSLVQAMRYMVENPDLRQQMALEARSFALRGRLGTSVQFSTMFGGHSDWSWANEPVQDDTAGGAIESSVESAA